MVNLVAGVEDLIAEGASKIADKAVVLEKSNAPVSSGKLMASIHKVANGRFSYIITTQAFGDNGFQYPAHIEAGQGVVATQAKALRFTVHGKTVITKSTKPSVKSKFADKTVKNLHI